MVTRAKSHIVGQRVHIDVASVIAYVGLPPAGKHTYIYKYGENEIEEHSPGHHEQPLPGRVTAQLPGLRLGTEVVRVHGLVDHPGNLAVASERKPPDAVFRV